MLRLKVILQSNYVYYILVFLSIILILLSTGKIKISKYDKRDNLFCGIITKVTKNNFILKEKESILIRKKEKMKFGDYICIKGDLNTPENNTVPNNFNYKKYLKNKNIHYIIYDYTLISKKTNKNFYYKIKNIIHDKLSEDSKLKEYYKTLFLGDKSYLEKAVKKSYLENGISHVFSFSGMHLNLLNLVAVLLLSKLKIKEVTKKIINIIFILFYFSLIIYSLSAIRSLIFYLLLTINKEFDFNLSTFKIFLISSCSILIVRPVSALDISFQYSFLATLGLVLAPGKRKSTYFTHLLKASITALLCTLPLSLFYNFELNILSIINNIIMIPVITFILYPCLILTLFIPYITPFSITLVHFIEKINLLLNNINWLTIVIPRVHIIFYIAYYILLYLYLKTLDIKYIMWCLLLILSFKIKPYLDTNDYIYFFDVSQGDSSLIIKDNKLTMIDTGGVYNYNVSDNTIKFIKSLGYSKLDLLVLTHGDSDHIKDASNIIKNLKVKNVIFNNNEYNKLELDLIKLLDEKNISYFKNDKNLKLSNNEFKLLKGNNYDNENDNSIVLYTSFNNIKMLFMGDAGYISEREIIENYKLKDIDILKVGHHGSSTSSSSYFINNINPKTCIISVGKRNRYNHPSKSVLNTLKDCQIYRTDLKGTVIIKSNKNKYSIKTVNP